MKEQLLELEERALKEIAAVDDPAELENFRIKYLGKKGQLTSIMKNVGGLPPDERPKIGKFANLVKTNLSKRFGEAKDSLLSGKVSRDGFIDVTLPGKEPIIGHLHPITSVIKEVCQIFSRMGFRVVKGPNVELDYYNFEALNIPKDHPARTCRIPFTSPIMYS